MFKSSANKITREYENCIQITDAAEIKKRLLNILIYIKGVCEENNIRYYLAYGTLIGAIRHQGFIPWDDDIDIMMPRPDYERFVSLFNDPYAQYQVLTPLMDNYYYNYGKVVDTETILFENGHKPIEKMGLYVDVFPLDGIPKNKKERIKLNKEYVKARRKIGSFGKPFPNMRKNIFKYCDDVWYYLISRITTLDKCQKEYLELANQTKYHVAEYLYVAGGAIDFKSGISNIYPAKWFKNKKDVVFEGTLFPAPYEYDNVLRQLYGDYMILPSEEKQISRHDFVAYFR